MTLSIIKPYVHEIPFRIPFRCFRNYQKSVRLGCGGKYGRSTGSNQRGSFIPDANPYIIHSSSLGRYIGCQRNRYFRIRPLGMPACRDPDGTCHKKIIGRENRIPGFPVIKRLTDSQIFPTLSGRLGAWKYHAPAIRLTQQRDLEQNLQFQLQCLQTNK